MNDLTNFIYRHKKDLFKWSSDLIIISSFFTALYTIVDSKNDLKVNIALQNGTTMLQDLINNSNLQNVLIHNLIVKQENCGYLNRQGNNAECEKSILAYEKLKIEIESSNARTFNSQERYTGKVNDLVENYDTYNYWQSTFVIIILLTNLFAFILNHKAK